MTAASGTTKAGLNAIANVSVKAAANATERAAANVQMPL
jgi:hypothetical protein